MQRVVLELDHDDFFCPVTGQRILGPESFEPSPATSFVFVPEAGEFEYLAPQFEEMARRVADRESTEEGHEDDEDDVDAFERFVAAVADPNVVVFSITTRDIACGPISSTVHIGIDLNCQREGE